MSFSLKSEFKANGVEIIENEGYPAEVHNVITEDGYILSVHRIAATETTSKVVLLMHGMQLSSFVYVGLGREFSLAFQLYDNGYDVWMGNVRGTEFSRKHRKLNSNSQEFWNFSFHEMGIYDLPAMIDDILMKTNQTAIHYAGHSQGTTIAIVLLSVKPSYNRKMLTLHLMSPVVYMRNTIAVLRTLARLAYEFDEIFTVLGLAKEIFLVDDDTRKFLAKMCNLKSVAYEVCKTYVSLILGPNPEQWNDKLFINTTNIFEHIPNSISLRQVMHYTQAYNTGRFMYFDYKHDKNLSLYNQTKPPEYNLRNIRAKIHILYGTNDNLVNYKDVEILIESIKPMTIGISKLIGWNHGDFFMARDVNPMVNNKILNLMNRYSVSGK